MPRASWELEEGDEIGPGRHAIMRLGGGNRYEVYLALDQALLSTVVCKLARPDHLDDRTFAEMRRESGLLRGLEHPGLLRCFDVALDGEHPHLMLEHIEGPTLRHLIKRFGVLSLEQILPLALHVCSVLHYLAGRKLVHMDVKPENLIMGAPPRLIDLSVAMTHDQAAVLTKRIGTYSYMAPEQILPGRAGPIGPAADVWGLGVMLYMAVAGRSPFPHPKGEDLAPEDFPQLNDDPPFIERELPPLLTEIIDACLNKDPTQRPDALQIALALEPLVAALPRTPVLRRFRPGRRAVTL